MAIAYSLGTYVNSVFASTLGTKAELITNIEDSLNTAGWTTISGHHTTNVLLQSVATPASLQCRVQVFDNSGNCVVIRFRNVANTKAAANGQFLLPGIGKAFRIIASQYQFFIATPGFSNAREACGGGCIYTPSFTGITECIWSNGNASSDTDTSARTTFKDSLNVTSGPLSSFSSTWVTVNGTQWEGNGGGIGTPTLFVPFSSYLGFSASSGYRWFDNSAFISEPLISFGSTQTSEGKVCGQLWDAAIITDSIASETSLTFDSHNWLTYTNANSGIVGSYVRGTLCLVVP